MSEKARTEPKGRPTPARPPKTPTAPPAPTGEPTAPTAWRSVRRQGHLITLPSGNAARVRRTFNMLNLVEQGSIPNPLGKHISDAVEEARKGAPSGGMFDLRNLDQTTDEGQLAFAQFLRLMMESMSDIFVSPRVLQIPEGEDPGTWEPGYRGGELAYPEEQENAISVADLDVADQMYAFSFAQGGADSMASFREGPDEAVVSTQDGGDVPL